MEPSKPIGVLLYGSRSEGYYIFCLKCSKKRSHRQRWVSLGGPLKGRIWKVFLDHLGPYKQKCMMMDCDTEIKSEGAIYLAEKGSAVVLPCPEELCPTEYE